MQDYQILTERARFNILVAEDEPSNQFLLERVLQRYGHNVTIVNNGQEALNFLDKHSYDLALFDMQMPVMGGVEAIEKYRKKNLLQNIPFILLTANDKDDAISQCKNIEIDFLLTKPASARDLIEAINQVCSSQYEHNE